ncbi:MAG TPA: succinate dehydrogenase/fumarate reductase iron-sulfur subunit [bacterium]|nr:succinate dehydrogenase/fumarate reductase iron-sulfur subunit [bacterium]
MNTCVLHIRRYDSVRSYWQEFTVDPTGKTVLDALKEIRDTQDQTLAYRAQCRSGICGSCAMRINGQARLACKTFVTDVLVQGKLTLEPLTGFGIIRDLVIEESLFWETIAQIKPWIEAAPAVGSVPEWLADESADSYGVENCILCAACQSDCEVHEVKQGGYAGPAGFVQAYRYVRDPRDHTTRERLQLLESQGIWSCTHIQQCSDVCPKGIRIGRVITALRSLLLRSGMGKNPGGRHVEAFTSGVRKHGKLDEFWTMIRTRGMRILSDLPVGWRMTRRGKVVKPVQRKSENSNELKHFFRDN